MDLGGALLLILCAFSMQFSFSLSFSQNHLPNHVRLESECVRLLFVFYVCLEMIRDIGASK